MEVKCMVRFRITKEESAALGEVRKMLLKASAGVEGKDAELLKEIEETRRLLDKFGSLSTVSG